jgi:formylglycine-generating enzyme required for sulfatase activity
MSMDRNWRSPGFAQSDDHPVTCVSWNDALKFAEWLSRRDRQTYRLPTEAEWEYSCRGGRPSNQPFGIGDGRSLSSTRANFNGNYPYGGAGTGPYLARTSPVGFYPANDWGLYDMHGNVWQWCSDWYGEYPSDKVTNPTGPEKGSSRVHRSGSWYEYARGCRAAARDKRAPGVRHVNLGFRLARDASDQDK